MSAAPPNTQLSSTNSQQSPAKPELYIRVMAQYTHIGAPKPRKIEASRSFNSMDEIVTVRTAEDEARPIVLANSGFPACASCKNLDCGDCRVIELESLAVRRLYIQRQDGTSSTPSLLPLIRFRTQGLAELSKDGPVSIGNLAKASFQHAALSTSERHHDWRAKNAPTASTNSWLTLGKNGPPIWEVVRDRRSDEMRCLEIQDSSVAAKSEDAATRLSRGAGVPADEGWCNVELTADMRKPTQAADGDKPQGQSELEGWELVDYQEGFYSSSFGRRRG